VQAVRVCVIIVQGSSHNPKISVGKAIEKPAGKKIVAEFDLPGETGLPSLQTFIAFWDG
jgi:hypothetical protein